MGLANVNVMFMRYMCDKHRICFEISIFPYVIYILKT